MSRELFAIQLDRLSSVFPGEMTAEKATEYYAALSGISIDRVERGVTHLIRNHSGYFPQPAQIIKAVNESFVPVYNNKQIKYDFVELSEEEKKYRKVFLPYYMFIITSSTKGSIVGFKSFCDSPRFRAKVKIKVNHKECCRLIDKYCKPQIFKFDKGE